MARLRELDAALAEADTAADALEPNDDDGVIDDEAGEAPGVGMEEESTEGWRDPDTELGQAGSSEFPRGVLLGVICCHASAKWAEAT